jgi:hypothetical protein
MRILLYAAGAVKSNSEVTCLDYFRYCQLLFFVIVVLPVVVIMVMLAHLSQYLQRIKWVIFIYLSFPRYTIMTF